MMQNGGQTTGRMWRDISHVRITDRAIPSKDVDIELMRV